MAVHKTNHSDLPSALLHSAKYNDIDVKEGIRGTKDEGKVFIIQGKIALEAVEDKILVLLDKFKTGYECKTCDGVGILNQCPTCKGAGLDRFLQHCKTCSVLSSEGKLIESLAYPRDCDACKGVGATIIVPETTKGMPTSGLIVGAGPKCVSRVLGERVLFGAHTGYYLPFKGNVRIRLMREHEVMCLMHKIDPRVSMEDFNLLQEPIDNSTELK